ncbi:MAG: prepilin peptidase [bacterium]
MIIFLPLFIFGLGLLVGSFLGVVIVRFHTGRSIVKGRSKCDRCNRTLEWYEMLPVVSFLALRGKCRTCKLHLSFQHPIVELCVAISFVLLYIHTILLGLPLALSVLYFIFSATVASVLIVVFAYDLKHKIIPDRLVYILGALSLGMIAFVTYTAHSFIGLGDALIAGPLVATPFFLIWLISKGRAMGFGDVKLALVLGWLLGIRAGVVMIFVSFWIGGIVGLFLLALSKKHSLKSEIPFAPFLIIATALVVLGSLTQYSFLQLWF